MIKVIQKRADDCKLKNCTPGLFYYQNMLCIKLKNEDECYIIADNPEFFYFQQILCIKIQDVTSSIKNKKIFPEGIMSNEMRDELWVTPVSILENNYYVNNRLKDINDNKVTRSTNENSKLKVVVNI